MTSQERALNAIIREIEKSVSGFDKSIPSIEKQVYSRLTELVKDLKLQSGRIAMVTENVRLIASIKSEIEKLILSKPYLKSVKEFLSTFDAVTTLQNNYFTTMVDKFSPSRVLNSVKKEAINSTATALTEAGISANVTEGIQNILRRNINEGGQFSQLLDDLKGFIVSSTDNPGVLARYANQITTDALNQYSATYNETVSSDLGFKWRMYTGSLLETSRPWCVHMVKKKYVHESELQTVISDHIDGVKICSSEIPCNKKTGLPSGMIKGTDASNVANRRGGWQCGHQFGGVPDAVVPKNIRMKFEKVEV